MSPREAWSHVEDWLGAPASWVPAPGPGHRTLLGGLLIDLDLRAGLVSDAALAAICLEHGLAMVSADSDFARFPGLRRLNPLTGRSSDA
ncbi:MAG: hypothetical protein V9G19_01980 [Tetrasphaera sp.]